MIDEQLEEIESLNYAAQSRMIKSQLSTDYTLEGLTCPECNKEEVHYSQYNPGYAYCQFCGTEFGDDTNAE